MRKSFYATLLLKAGLVLNLLAPSLILAFHIEDLPGTPVENDFVLGPGKIEAWLNPGEGVKRELMITNRLGRTMDFKIELEDFKGTRDPQVAVYLLGKEKGPYSLKDYLRPEVTEFTLNHGQRMLMQVEVAIPADAEPGGRYGSVFIAAQPPATELTVEKEKAKGQIQSVTRLGSLLFVRVKGDVKEEGFFQNFKVSRKFYDKGPVVFQLYFENNGNVHLSPYGLIEIKNILGKKVGEIELDSWFVLPDSLRLREVKWERPWLFGKYTAQASVNRGYQDIVDGKSISFYFIPWKMLLLALVVLSATALAFYWVATRFEIRRKEK